MLHSLLTFFQSLGLPGIYLSMFIENLGIPFPTEGFYLLGQSFISSGKYSYLVISITLTLGHMSGATIAYFIGRKGESVLLKKLKNNQGFTDSHDKIQKWFKKYGNITIFLTRMTGYVRPWSSLIIGFAKVPFKTFFIWALLGTMVFNAITLYVSGYLIQIWHKFSSYQYIFIIISILIFLIIFVYYPLSIYKRYAKKR